MRCTDSHEHVNIFAVATVAVIVTALAFAYPAQAEIVFAPVNVVMLLQR